MSNDVFSPRMVSLREITQETVREVLRLTVRDDQRELVAPNATSLAQALFAPQAWYRAIYSGQTMPGSAEGFDRKLGFEPTGAVDEDGEIIMALALESL